MCGSCWWSWRSSGCASRSCGAATGSSVPTSVRPRRGRRDGRGAARRGGGPVNTENIVGLILAVLLARVPRRRAAVPGAVLMTFAAWGQLIALIVAARGHRAAARPLHRARLRRRPVAPRPRVRTRRALHLPALPHRSRARAALERLRALVPRVQRRRRAAALRDAAAPEQPAVQPDRHGERDARRSRSTPRSASSPTRTGRTTAARRR